MIEFIKPIPVLITYAALVAALVVAEFKENASAQRMLKPLAALGFIFIGLSVGALDHRYGQIVLSGLIACALGDVYLLSRNSPKLFIAGMAAFAFGHFAYLTAFVTLGTETISLAHIIKSGLVIAFGAAVFAWLQPNLPKNMRLVVPLYFLIILIMVINALRLPLEQPFIFAMIGAVLFAASDVFVARDRFVRPSPKNALAITPLYFGAQALIAFSAQAPL